MTSSRCIDRSCYLFSPLTPLGRTRCVGVGKKLLDKRTICLNVFHITVLDILNASKLYSLICYGVTNFGNGCFIFHQTCITMYLTTLVKRQAALCFNLVDFFPFFFL